MRHLEQFSVKTGQNKANFAFYMPKYYFNITLKVRRLENGMLLPVVAAKGKTQFANVAAFFFLTFFKTPLTPPPPSL